MSNNSQMPSLGLYVHWPFCRHKCPYCDFNSHVSTAHDNEKFGAALCDEITHMATLLPERRILTSLFFGGGTPSLMPPAIVAKIITQAEKIFGFAPAIEITAEANPTSIEAQMMNEFYHAGVNRVSMGMQSLDDDTLNFLGRKHSVAESLSALKTVQHCFDNVSVDLIYATTNDTLTSWHKSLSHALSLDLPHLSLYQLIIEPGTVFYTRQRNGERLNLDDDQAADLYELTQNLTAEAGLPAYEVSNHAKPGKECQHNLTYWRSGDWIGVGPGAHGRFNIKSDGNTNFHRFGTITQRNPTSWLRAVQKNGHGIKIQTDDTADELATEMVMMGLRMSEGIKIKEIEALCGPQDRWLDRSATTRAIEAGWLDLHKDDHTCSNSRLYATVAGRMRLNHILATILR